MTSEEATSPLVCSNTPATEITVRPKSDMDEEKLAENEITIDAVRPMSDLDAEDLVEDAKTSKNVRILSFNS